jgi:hypothetical protein
MSDSKPSARDYLVFQLTLGLGEDGQPVQYAAPRGAFESVEPAFELARELAVQEVERLAEPAEGEAESRSVEMIDTEWGYDLRRGWLTISRFWVHDASADRPLLAGR